MLLPKAPSPAGKCPGRLWQQDRGAWQHPLPHEQPPEGLQFTGDGFGWAEPQSSLAWRGAGHQHRAPG